MVSLSKKWYATHGILFQRCYLLYGLLGSGKTSLIHALAGSLGLDIYVVSLPTSWINDTQSWHPPVKLPFIFPQYFSFVYEDPSGYLIQHCHVSGFDHALIATISKPSDNQAPSWSGFIHHSGVTSPYLLILVSFCFLSWCHALAVMLQSWLNI